MMNAARYDGLFVAIFLIVLIYVMVIVDRKYLNRSISRLFGNQKFRIILAAIILICMFFFAKGRYSGVFFLI
ncbi:hypothetical protein [Zophobihabitans entericus]|uniref:Uncharacterized protein n=1 Tax=Zophobihabitans entericus TaxID=1635327 RepID=A0A6G9IAK4_9GAMM|nr:hypothetical protein [Zophobihabitans entericus]QIQ20862.1 hypothetical protein IPMB12_03705 [Zophobihabitans entericus]